MRILVLTNSEIASWRASRNQAITRLADLFHKVGLAPEIEALPPARLAERARAAVHTDTELVVAAGGDGTVGAVAGALAGSQVALGVLPLGTFNHFARDLSIPLVLDQAVRVLASGVRRKIDVGDVNGHTFVNNCSIGAYPVMVADRELQRKRGRRKWWAMSLAFWRVALRFPLFEVRLAIDDQEPWCTTPFVFVGNNRYRFGLAALGTRAALDKGLLSVYAARCAARRDILRLATRAALGRLENDPSLTTFEMSEFWVESRRRRLNVAIDGELARVVPPLHFRSRPQSLEVIVPAT